VRFGDTIQRIVEAVRSGKLSTTFSPSEVNVALGITFAGTFLPKHRVGNPDDNTPLFIQVDRGRYQLNRPYLHNLGL
jgi:hypothetical protein